MALTTTTTELADRLHEIGVVPVVVLDRASDAKPLAAALLSGGLPIAEVTLRTDAALAVVEKMAADPAMLVGAGTVLAADQVDDAVDAGASFIVSPGFGDAVVARCLDRGIPVFPGVATASEVMRAHDAGLRVVKFFPAEASGGLAAVKALSAPFPMMSFVPTGGIHADTAAAYLRHPAVTAVGGSWMVARSLVAAGRFDEIGDLAAAAVATARTVREGDDR